VPREYLGHRVLRVPKDLRGLQGLLALKDTKDIKDLQDFKALKELLVRRVRQADPLGLQEKPVQPVVRAMLDHKEFRGI
jgi:hypothetical protein